MDLIKPISNPKELATALDIIKRSFSTVAREFNFTQEIAPAFPAWISGEIINAQIAAGLRLFMFEKNFKAIGCIGVSSCPDSDLFKDLFKIERLAVLPEFRHLGIGKSLMDFAIKEIHKSQGKAAQVEIVNENTRLKKWYIDLGFKEIRIDRYENLPFTVGILHKTLDL